MHRHRRLLYYIRRTCICSMLLFCLFCFVFLFFCFSLSSMFLLFYFFFFFNFFVVLCVSAVCDCRLPFCWYTQYYLSSIIWTYIIVYNRECMVGTFFYLFISYFFLFFVFCFCFLFLFFHIFTINWWMTRSTTSTGRGKHKSSACHSHDEKRVRCWVTLYISQVFVLSIFVHFYFILIL